MPRKNTVRLPAITVEVPQMGMVVYVSPEIGAQDNKWTCMFTAEITIKGRMELQSFHLKCDNEKDARAHIKMFADRLAKGGKFPFIRTSF